MSSTLEIVCLELGETVSGIPDQFLCLVRRCLKQEVGTASFQKNYFDNRTFAGERSFVKTATARPLVSRSLTKIPVGSDILLLARFLGQHQFCHRPTEYQIFDRSIQVTVIVVVLDIRHRFNA